MTRITTRTRHESGDLPAPRAPLHVHLLPFVVRRQGGSGTRQHWEQHPTTTAFEGIDPASQAQMDEIVSLVPDRNASILDMGCNVGRHLDLSLQPGLPEPARCGLELRRHPRHGDTLSPGCYAASKLTNASFEDFLAGTTEQVDLVYTRGATFEIVHPGFPLREACRAHRQALRGARHFGSRARLSTVLGIPVRARRLRAHAPAPPGLAGRARASRVADDIHAASHESPAADLARREGLPACARPHHRARHDQRADRIDHAGRTFCVSSPTSSARAAPRPPPRRSSRAPSPACRCGRRRRWCWPSRRCASCSGCAWNGA